MQQIAGFRMQNEPFTCTEQMQYFNSCVQYCSFLGLKRQFEENLDKIKGEGGRGKNGKFSHTSTQLL